MEVAPQHTEKLYGRIMLRKLVLQELQLSVHPANCSSISLHQQDFPDAVLAIAVECTIPELQDMHVFMHFTVVDSRPISLQ